MSESIEFADRLKELAPDHVVDELLEGTRTDQKVTAQGGLSGQLTKRMRNLRLPVRTCRDRPR